MNVPAVFRFEKITVELGVGFEIGGITGFNCALEFYYVEFV